MNKTYEEYEKSISSMEDDTLQVEYTNLFSALEVEKFNSVDILKRLRIVVQEKQNRILSL